MSCVGRSTVADSDEAQAKALTLRDPVTGEETSTMLSLPNGCLCCSFKDMGIAAIEEMVASQGGVDWVMVELTGLADPGELQSCQSTRLMMSSSDRQGFLGQRGNGRFTP